MTHYIISAGQISKGIVLKNGDTEVIYSGGIASGTVVNSGGLVTILSGGIADATVVNNGGADTIYSGGVASATVVNAGGNENISGGTAKGTVVNGGYENISAGIASGTQVNSGGGIYVYSGAFADNTVVQSGSYEDIASGGIVSGGSVANGGTIHGLVLTSGHYVAGQTNTIDGITLPSGAIVEWLTVVSGAVTQGFIDSGVNQYVGNFEIILDGGIASGTVVDKNSWEVISSKGTASGTVVNSGGSQGINSGGIADNTVLYSGGDENVNFQGIANGTVIYTGGSEAIIGGSASGTVVMSGGHLGIGNYYSFASTATDTTIQNGGELVIQSSDSVISGLVLSAGALIDFDRITVTSAAVNGADQLLITSGGTVLESLGLSGHYSNSSFTLQTDGFGGTLLTVNAPVLPSLTTVNYNATSGQLTLIGRGLTSNATGYVVTDLSLKGDGGVSYALSSGSTIIGTPSAVEVTIQLSSADQLAVDGLLNKTGTTANDGKTAYNLSAAAGWDTGASVISTQAVTVSNAVAPAINTVSYDAATGVLTVTGANLDKHGSANGIALADLSLTVGSGSYHFNASQDSVSNLTANGFSVTLSNADHGTLNALIDNNGSQSLSGAVYKLNATANWDSDAGAAFTGQSVIVSGLDIFSPPTISNLVEGYGQIELSKTIFTAFAGDTVVTAANFSNATSATSVTDYLYYNAGNGGLYYDADGSASHSNGVEIAVIGVSSHPATLSAADFKLIA